METVDDKYILKSLDNSLELLELLVEEEEMGVTEMAEELGLGKSTIFRMLKTLEKWNYIRQNTDNTKYRIGMKLQYMGALVAERDEIVRTARPFLKELTEKTQETSHLMKLDYNNEIVFLDKIDGPFIMNMQSRVGGHKPAYIAGSGKLYLSEMSPVELDLYLENISFEKLTRHSLGCREELMAELDQVRRQGYAENKEESQLGLISYAVPVRDKGGSIIASISISGMDSRMLDDKPGKIKLLLEAAAKIQSYI